MYVCLRELMYTICVQYSVRPEEGAGFPWNWNCRSYVGVVNLLLFMQVTERWKGESFKKNLKQTQWFPPVIVALTRPKQV